MRQSSITNYPLSMLHRCLRFCVGLVLLILLAGFFMSGATPPGICGEVLRHNQLYKIDASGMFYTEVERMPQLEEGVRKLRAEAKRQRK
jgi:hypothetical protein